MLECRPTLVKATGLDQVEQTFFPPHIFLGIPVNDRLEVSFAFYTPFGLGTGWEDDFRGNYIAKKTDLMIFDLGVSMAYKISENFAFGIGVDYMVAQIELTRDIGLINPYDQRLTSVAEASLKGEGINSAWAWNAGILWKMGGGFSFGALVPLRLHRQRRRQGDLHPDAHRLCGFRRPSQYLLPI